MLTLEADLSIRIDGMITEVMKRKKLSKADLSLNLGMGKEALTRLSTNNELWKLSGDQIAMIAEAAGRDVDFPRRR